jgi:hypothetical protein
MFTQEGQERSQGALLQDVIPALRTITSNIAKSPDSLFANIEHGGRKEVDEFGNSLGSDDDLSVLSSARCDIR